MENRFKRLRYKDDLCFHRKYTMDEFAEILQISKATISNLESSDDYDARISIIKQYKKAFPTISYDYFLGGKNTMNDYSFLEQTLPLGDQFYETLQALFRMDDVIDDNLTPAEQQAILDFENEMIDRVKNMLESLFSNSNRLFHYLSDTYKSLLRIYLLEHRICEDETSVYSKEKLAFEWYQFTQETTSFFKDIVYEDLNPILELEREAAIKRHQEYEEYKKKKAEALYPTTDEGNLPF